MVKQYNMTKIYKEGNKKHLKSKEIISINILVDILLDIVKCYRCV